MSTTVLAQTYNVHLNDGTTVKYAAEDVNYVDFTIEKKITPINLGLPSGTLWSPVNIGAASPEEYGNHYAWGETATKADHNFTWDTYTLCEDGNSWKCQDIGTDITGTVYDVAHTEWGNDWLMPTAAQCEELLEVCQMEYILVNEVGCVQFTGPNGNAIIFPLAGRYYDDRLDNAGDFGWYWTSTRYEVNDRNARMLTFGKGGSKKVSYASRSNGHSVRPVKMANK